VPQFHILLLDDEQQRHVADLENFGRTCSVCHTISNIPMVQLTDEPLTGRGTGREEGIKEYPPLLIYESDINRLRQFGVQNGCGDSAMALRLALDWALDISKALAAMGIERAPRVGVT